MNLSEEIQARLHKINSSVALSYINDGTFPDEYAFYHRLGRSFRTEFAATEHEFSIVLFERTDKLDYENCYARGIFKNIDRLVNVIGLWVGKQQDILELKAKFDELELFTDFDFKNPNQEIDAAWTKVKNMFFNRTWFWEKPEWNSRYILMLNEAKKHNAFKNYFPFTSHYWLRFSIDKDLKETWTLDTFIFPTFYSEETPATLGKFYVSFDDEMSRKYFENLHEALDFYAEKLHETKPIKWSEN
ncbi:MAG TPA: hypothetical protein VEC36_12820 [Patescibacteria group bacterium]|nr:hypothetical protein [Patescibacteria group bacterium]